MAKGTGDHTQADPDAVEKALGPHTQLPGVAGTIGTDLAPAVQGTADVLKLVLVINRYNSHLQW